MNKRNIIIAIIFAVFSLITVNNATAQLNGTEVKSPKEVMKVNSNAWVYETSRGYEIWANTDNMFDDGFNKINLGRTKEECLASLNDIMSICENTSTVVVKQATGTVTIMGFKIDGKEIVFKEDEKYGSSRLKYRYIKKIVSYFENIAE